jgi:hypothetical protein
VLGTSLTEQLFRSASRHSRTHRCRNHFLHSQLFSRIQCSRNHFARNFVDFGVCSLVARESHFVFVFSSFADLFASSKTLKVSENLTGILFSVGSSIERLATTHRKISGESAFAVPAGVGFCKSLDILVRNC